MNLFSAPTSDEWLLFAFLFSAIGLFIFIAEYLRNKLHGSPEITRKLVHILTGVLIFFAPDLFRSGVPAILLAVIFIVINFTAIQLGLLKGMHGTHRRTYGTVYYPLSFLILVLLCWDSAPELVSISILILAFSDAAAAIVGENLHHPHEYYLTSDKKSYEGSLVMFVTTIIIIVVCIDHFGIVVDRTTLIIAAVATALFVTVWEAISSKGFDNLTVPLSAALMLHSFFIPFPHHESSQMLYAVLFASGVAVISVYLKFLSPSGAAATFLLATIIFGLGGWKWTIPILIFFVASSLLSKIEKSQKRHLEAIVEKTDMRDEGQVAANGGIAGIILLLWYFFPNQEFLYPCYLGTLAAVTADTWSTEIGTLAKQKPVSIISLKKVEAGTSGGVSFVGMIGGIMGAMTIAYTGWLIDAETISLTTAGKIVAAGFIGSLVDSLLGATIQAQYQSDGGVIVERTVYHGKPTTLVRGFRWINNDIVNWLCACTGAVVLYALM